MRCEKCGIKITLIEWIMNRGYCFIHMLEQNGEITLK
jgi:hypothetical protein